MCYGYGMERWQLDCKQEPSSNAFLWKHLGHLCEEGCWINNLQGSGRKIDLLVNLWKNSTSPGSVSTGTGSPRALMMASNLSVSTDAKSPDLPWFKRPRLWDPGIICRHPFSLESRCSFFSDFVDDHKEGSFAFPLIFTAYLQHRWRGILTEPQSGNKTPFS